MKRRKNRMDPSGSGVETGNGRCDVNDKENVRSRAVLVVSPCTRGAIRNALQFAVTRAAEASSVNFEKKTNGGTFVIFQFLAGTAARFRPVLGKD